MRWMIVVGMVYGACTSDGTDALATGDTGSPSPGPNAPPTVMLDDETLLPGESVTLAPIVDDPDGDPLTYLWQLRTSPPLSRVQIEDRAASQISFTPDRFGTYVVDVTVSDGVHSVGAFAVVTALSGTARPRADAGPDLVVAVGRDVVLDGSASEDPGGRYLFYEWFFDEVPAGSTLERLYQDPVVTVVPDVVGQYRAELTVHNGSVGSAVDDVLLDVKPDVIQPGAVAKGELLPGQVYGFGNTDALGCDRGVAHWSDLDVAMGGIDTCEASINQISLTSTGAVRYLQIDGVMRDLVCDGCPSRVAGDPLAKGWSDNDLVVVDTAPCDGKAHELPVGFHEGSDGRMLLFCDGAWRDDQDRTIGIEGSLAFPMAYDGDTAMTLGGVLVDFAKDTATRPKGLTASRIDAARTTKDGFWVAAEGALWLVDPDDVTAAWVADYPAFRMAIAPAVTTSVIDEEGTLFQTIFNRDTAQWELHRRRLDGVADTVQKLQGKTWLTEVFTLLTGP